MNSSNTASGSDPSLEARTQKVHENADFLSRKIQELSVEPAPHLSDPATTRRLMIDVVIALVPALIMSFIFFGASAVRLTAISLVTCLATEFVFNLIRQKKNSLGDFSAVVTAMILAFSLPPSIPTFAVVIGSVVAIAIGKMIFGGLGQNIFNPAMVGRAFLMIAFPVLMTTWTPPASINVSKSSVAIQKVDAVSQATPLAQMKPWSKHRDLPTTLQFFIGQKGGSLGETSVIALLLGAVYLLIRKTITWHIPVSMLLTVVIFGGIGWLAAPDKYVNPMFHLGAGALIFGAFFIATDLVSSPLSKTGQLIYGAGCGLFIMVIRQFGTYPEGVMFSILIMNGVAPMISRYTLAKPLGGKAHA
jgi:electron transport complex protein RnfD